MPQAAVRIAPSLLAAAPGPVVVSVPRPRRPPPPAVHPMIAPAGICFGASAEAGPRLRRGPRATRRPGERAGAENAPDLHGLVPVVSVNPGFGGRSPLESQLPKVDEAGRDTALGVGGGVPQETAPRRVSAGAGTPVAGTAVSGAPDHAAATAALRGSA